MISIKNDMVKFKLYLFNLPARSLSIVAEFEQPSSRVQTEPIVDHVEMLSSQLERVRDMLVGSN